MTTFADTLKKEVSRLARKELKDDVGVLKKSLTQQRLEVSQLKKDLKALQQEVRRLAKLVAKTVPPEPEKASAAPRGRAGAFDAQALLACRQRLGLTQKDMAILLKTSSLSLWKWESGKSQPRAGNLEQIRLVLKMGKREAQAQLAAQHS